MGLFLRWWLQDARYSWSKFRRNLFERKYRRLALPIVNNLGDMEVFLRQVK